MYAQVRLDLRKEELGVPVGEDYVFDDKLYEYRHAKENGEVWLEGSDKDVADFNVFQIWFEGQWQDAMEIDWDFFEIYEYRVRSDK
jgi:hypothetical protein